jgi:hypothetical protein
MKSSFIKRFSLKALTSFALFAFVLSASMVTFAVDSKPVGEILVSGVAPEGKAVLVNGEPARSGRTIFASSTISTPEGMTATVNLGKAGRLQIASGSAVALDVNGTAVSADLTAGGLTVLNAAQNVGVKTAAGQTLSLAAGEMATASSTSAAKAQKGPGGLDWWVWAAIIGGAAAAVIIVVAASGDDSPTVTSPVR